MDIGYCQCGCGRTTALWRYGPKIRQPRDFIRGHHFRGTIKHPIVNGKKECSRCGILLPLDAFSLRPENGPDAIRGVCRTCVRGDMRWRNTKARWGLDQGAWETKFDDQGRACAICGTDSPGSRGWHVDHNHACCPGGTSCGHCVRGILCSNCNVGLGAFHDSRNRLIDAAVYLAGFS